LAKMLIEQSLVFLIYFEMLKFDAKEVYSVG
jgi:hypothetical protein